MDIFGRFARDPACLVAIDAANGGTWHSPFRPGVVYPSPTPRNFALSNAIWYDFKRVGNEIGHDDFEFEATFKNLIAISTTAAWLFYHNGQTGSVNIAYNADLSIYFLPFGLWDDSNNPLYPGSASKAAILASGIDIVSAGAIHTWTWGKTGSLLYVKLNGISVFSSTRAAYATGNFKSNTAPVSQFGNILSAKLTNFTTGNIVWNYPNFAEQTNLIVKSNVWTRNGVFEAASSAAVWSVKYAGTVMAGDYTAAIDTTAAVITQVRKSGVTATYTNGVSGGTLPYLNLAASTLSGAYGTKLRHFLLFDRALSIGEIQILR